MNSSWSPDPVESGRDPSPPENSPDSLTERNHSTWFSMPSLLLGMLIMGIIWAGSWYYKQHKNLHAVPSKSEQTTTQPAPAQPAQAACADRKYTVTLKNREQGLWGISKEMNGGIGHFNEGIFEVNKDRIKNPDIIQPGWVLVIPGCPKDKTPTTKKPEAKATGEIRLNLNQYSSKVENKPKHQASEISSSTSEINSTEESKRATREMEVRSGLELENYFHKSEYKQEHPALAISPSLTEETGPTEEKSPEGPRLMSPALNGETITPVESASTEPQQKAAQQTIVPVVPMISEAVLKEVEDEVSKSVQQDLDFVAQFQKTPGSGVVSPGQDSEVDSKESKRPPQETVAQKKSAKEKPMNVKSKVAATFKSIGRSIKNPRTVITSVLTVASFGILPYSLPVTIGGAAFLTASNLRAQVHDAGPIKPAPASMNPNATVPTLADVERMGRTPYLRFTPMVDPETGGPVVVPGSMFDQLPFTKENEELIKSKTQRGLVRDLGLTGKPAYNELCVGGYGIGIYLSKMALVYYTRDQQGKVVPLWLADCKCGGKPTQNRILLVPESPVEVKTVLPPGPTVQPSVPVNQENKQVVNIPPAVIPTDYNYNVRITHEGLPTNTTQTIITETRCGDWACKVDKAGAGVGKAAGGVGVLLFGARFPGAFERGMANRRPDQINLTQNASQSGGGATIGSVTGGGATMNGSGNSTVGPITTQGGSSSATTGPVTATSAPVVTSTSGSTSSSDLHSVITDVNKPVNNVIAQGGKGGDGGKVIGSGNSDNVIAPTISPTNNVIAKGGDAQGGSVIDSANPVSVTKTNIAPEINPVLTANGGSSTAQGGSTAPITVTATGTGGNAQADANAASQAAANAAAAAKQQANPVVNNPPQQQNGSGKGNEDCDQPNKGGKG
jgi:hypothetical protein